MVYADRNTIRAGVADEREEREWSGHRGAMGLRERCRVLDPQTVLNRIRIDIPDLFRAAYAAWARQDRRRQGSWTKTAERAGRQFDDRAGFPVGAADKAPANRSLRAAHARACKIGLIRHHLRSPTATPAGSSSPGPPDRALNEKTNGRVRESLPRRSCNGSPGISNAASAGSLSPSHSPAGFLTGKFDLNCEPAPETEGNQRRYNEPLCFEPRGPSLGKHVSSRQEGTGGGS